MKKMAEIKTVTYDAGDGFLLDVVDRFVDHLGIKMYEAWIYRGDSTWKMFVYGANPKFISKREFVKKIFDRIDVHKDTYDEESDLIEYAHCELDDDDCDCENCPYHDEDCDDCDCCEDTDDGIEYPEDGSTPIATIKMCKLIGTEEEITKAREIREKYLDNLHDTFVTENHYGLLQFARWAAQRFNMASFWISMADSYDDMMTTAFLMHVWFTETSSNTEQKGA